MVKNYSDSKRGNPHSPPHGLLIPISGKGSFIYTIPLTGKYILCYTSRGKLAGMRNSSMCPPLGNDLKTHHKYSITELRFAPM